MKTPRRSASPRSKSAVIGSEEQNPGLANVARLGRMLGMLPMPVKYHLYFGEPLHFHGSPTEDDAIVDEKVDQVKAAITALFERGLAERRGVFT